MPASNGRDDEHPFGMPWLDSSYQETLLPSAPWHKVEEKISRGLAAKLEKQLAHPDRRQMIFELLGRRFVERYFPSQLNDPSVLDRLGPEERNKLQLDAQTWLQSQLSKVATETGCHRPQVLQQTNTPLAPEMAEFLEHTHSVLFKGMDRHVYLQESELVQMQREEVYKKKQERDQQRVGRQQQKQQEWEQRLRQQDSGVKGILKHSHPPPTAASSISSVSTRPPQTADVKEALHKLHGDDPHLSWGIQSNGIGRSVIAILKRDPRRFTEVTMKLHGRQLPASLRSYIYVDVLLKREREKMKDVNVEKIVRERFGKAVARGVGDLRIKRPTHSPISGLIDNAVIEIYDGTSSMQAYMNNNTHMKETAKALNVLYVYDRSYEPYLVHWLFPLQLAFQESSGEDDHVYELAMYLDLLNKDSFPTWPHVFGIADRVMSRLSKGDPELYEHITRVAQVNPTVNPKEFLVQLLHEERTQAEVLQAASPSSLAAKDVSRKLLADPLVFIRKWVGEGFVSVLDTQAVLYVWDQMFMQRWKHRPIEDICLTLLMLLRHKFLQTQDYTTMKQVFLREPCKLYTKDIQRGFINLQKDSAIIDVAPMNRQRPRTPVFVAPAKSPAPSEITAAPLDPVGLKHFWLKIVITAQAARKEQWLAEFASKHVQLSCALHFGSIKLQSRPLKVAPVQRKVETDKYGSKSYLINFPKERFIFEEVDLAQYDVEREMGGYPYAIVSVQYARTEPGRQTPKTPVTLGWTRLRVYERPAQGERAPSAGPLWVVRPSDTFYTLYPGDVPEGTITVLPGTPTGPNRDLIGSSSELGILVFDPRNEPVTPVRELSPEPVKQRTPVPVAVLPPPKKETPKPVTPAAKATPTPAPAAATPTPTPTPEDETETEEEPEDNRPGLDDPFDLYVDAVTLIPDNASLVKVTGRLIKTGTVKNIPDILAFPEMDSSARSPLFKYRLALKPNKENEEEMEPGLLVLMRLYTVDMDTRELVVAGSCFFELFDQKEKLKVGGHRRYLHHGMPNMRGGISGLSGSSLDSHPRIPVCSIFFRLLPHTEDFEPAPDLRSKNFYVLEDKDKLNASEQRVVQSFGDQGKQKVTVAAMANMLRKAETKVSDKEDDSDSTQELNEEDWFKGRLDNKKYLKPNQPAGHLALSRMVQYRIKTGLKVQVMQAFGLPEGLYVQCFIRVAPGQVARDMDATPEGFGKDDKFITVKHNYESLQKAPIWIDGPKMLHPHQDENSILLIQVFGLDAVYRPVQDHNEAGTVHPHKGKELTLAGPSVLGWAVVPLFDGKYVFVGEHIIPLFKGQPKPELLEELTDDWAEDTLAQATWDESNKYPASGLVVKLWDAHYDEEDLLEPLEQYTLLLDAVGGRQPYMDELTVSNVLQAEEKKSKRMNLLVINSLERKYKQLGTGSDVFTREVQFYEEAMGDTFFRLMESELINAGYGPL